MAAARAAMGTTAEDVEFVDYDHDDDEDAMDEDDRTGGRALPVPHIVSQGVMRTRGRLLGRSPSVLASNRDRFDSLADAGNSGHGPQRSIEGWILLVSGVKEDAEEDDLYNAFSEFGHVKDLHFNLERHTGYGKILRDCYENSWNSDLCCLGTFFTEIHME
ncbi:hypothetical protein E2562_005343 [Oryza meyeriana var. granulata]|uniref:RRM domain-containing protein n=1 Tax=Oryza meyeriana var. granulata TaxID=110450 RepID=A0A6G1DEW2_9ORYZ|nr:hypothetical protein E2562_005343 [Oryza meyeriana var. granulata]